MSEIVAELEQDALPDTHQIATQFVRARLAASSLPDYPGVIPRHLSQSYAIQDKAIALWPDTISGWKVGRILGDLSKLHNCDRLIGPIFAQTVQRATIGSRTKFAAFSGGFCAVEAEYVFELSENADPTHQDYSSKSALALVKTLWTGIEIAGSPLATINALGPTVVVSDFGNNHGLILGNEVQDWRARLSELACTLDIDDVRIGDGDVSSIPAGILGSLVFALNCAASRGMALQAGMLISTGAVTGVHDIMAGQSAHAGFGIDGSISCARIA